MIEQFLQEPELSHLSLSLLVGGRSVEADAASMQSGAQIAVCTPGRLQDLLAEQKHLNLPTKVKELVRNNLEAPCCRILTEHSDLILFFSGAFSLMEFFSTFNKMLKYMLKYY